MQVTSIVAEALGPVTITVEAMEVVLGMAGRIRGLETGIVKRVAVVRIILQAGPAASSVGWQRMREVVRERVTLDAAVAMSREAGEQEALHRTLLLLGMGIARDGDQETGCVPGLDAMSITLQLACSAFDAKLQERLNYLKTKQKTIIVRWQGLSTRNTQCQGSM